MKSLKFVQNAGQTNDSSARTKSVQRILHEVRKNKEPNQDLVQLAPPKPHPQQEKPRSRSSLSPPSKTERAVSELKQLVLNEANRTKAPEVEMSLVHLLNTFDSVMQQLVPRPAAETANEVYRNLLQRQNNKTYASIQSIQNEIEGMEKQFPLGKSASQQIQTESLHSNQDLIGNHRMSTYHTASFAQEEEIDSQNSDYDEKVNLKVPPILIVQANSRNNRQVSSVDSKSTDRSAYRKDSTSDQRNQITQSQKIRQYLYASGSGGATSTLTSKKTSTHQVFSPQQYSHEFEMVSFDKEIRVLGLSGFQLIEEIQRMQRYESFIRRCQKFEKFIQPTSACSTGRLNADLQSVQRRKKKLPKLKITQNSPQSSTSSSEELFFNSDRSQKVIDSNGALVVAYSVRRLLIKGLKAIQASIFEQKARNFVLNVCQQTYQKSLMRNVFKRLYQYKEQHLGHQSAKLKAQKLLRSNVLSQVFNFWLDNYLKLSTERNLISRFNRKHIRNNKSKLFKAWRQVVVRMKVSSMQKQTAFHIRTKHQMLKVFHVLQSYARFNITKRYKSMRIEHHIKNWHFRYGFQAFVMNKNRKRNEKILFRQALQIRKKTLKRYSFTAINLHKCYMGHLRQLTEYATDFSIKRRMRNCFLQLVLNLSYQKERRYEIAKAISFYHFKLKRNLLSLIHESNLEFIRKSVHAETYFYRLNLRKVFQKLAKYAQRRKAALKCSGFQLYCLDLWVSSKQLEVSKSQKYTALYYRSQKTKANFVLGEVVRCWKQQAQNVKRITQKNTYKLAKQIFDRWAIWSGEISNSNKRLNKHLARKQRNLQQDVLQVFRLLVERSAKDRYAISKLKKMQDFNSLKIPFQKWVSKYKIIALKKQQKVFSKQLSQHKVHRKFFELWVKKLNVERKKQNLDLIKQSFEKQKRCKIFFKWLGQVLLHIKDCNKAQNFRAARNLHLKSVVWNVLVKRMQVEQTAKQLVNSFRLIQAQKYKRIVFDGWAQKFIPEVRVKNQLFAALKNDQNLIQLRKCFQVIKSFAKFKKSQRVRDQLLTQDIHQIFYRKYYRPWQKLFKLRLAFKHLNQITPQLQISYAFRQLKFENFVYKETKSHLNQQHELNLKRRTLTLFFRHAKRYAIREDKIQKMRQISLELLIQQNFRIWKESCQFILRFEQDVYKFILAFGRTLKLRVFSRFKQDYLSAKKLRDYQVQKTQSLVQNCFYQLKKFSTLSQLSQQWVKYQNKQQKVSIFKVWLEEIRIIKFCEQFLDLKRIKMRNKCFKQIIKWAQVNKCNRIIIQKGLQNNKYYLAKSTFRAIRTYLAQKKHLKQFSLRNDQLSSMHLKSIAFADLKKYWSRKLYHLRCETQIRQSLNLKMMAVNLSQWKTLSIARIQQYVGLRSVLKVNQKYMILQCMQAWNDYHQESRQLNRKADSFRQDQNKYMLSKLLFSMQEYSVKKKVSNQRLQSIKTYVTTRKLLKVFIALRQVTSELKITNNLKQKAYLYRQLLLQQKSIHLLNQYKIRQKRSRSLVQYLTRNRLIPKALTALKYYQHLRQVARGMQLKAVIFRRRKLLFEGMEVLIKFRNQQVQHKNFLANIDSIHHRSLLKSNLLEWIRRYNEHNILRQKRVMLYNAIQRVDNEWKKKVYFNYLRVGVLTSQQKWLKALVQNDRFLVANVICQWLKLVNKRKHLSVATQKIKQKRENKLQQQTLFNWLIQYSFQQKLKHVWEKKKFQTLRTVMTVLKWKVQKRFSVKYAILHSEGNILRKVWTSLRLNKSDMEQRREVMANAELSHYEKQLVRCMLAFKFNVVISKGLRILKQKQDQTLKLKVFDALKYNKMLCRVVNSYQQFKQNKMKQNFLQEWIKRTIQQKRFKNLMSPYLKRKILTERSAAFKLWKKGAFLMKMCQVLHYYVSAPALELTMRQVIFSWRKLAYLNKNKSLLMQEFQIRVEERTKRNFLATWYQQLVQKLPARVLAQKCDQIFRLRNLRCALIRIASVAAQRQRSTQVADQIIQQRQSIFVEKAYYRWKKAFQICKGEQIIVQRQKKRMYQKVLLVWYNGMLIAQKVNKNQQNEDILAQQAQQHRYRTLLKSFLLIMQRKILKNRNMKNAQIFYENKLVQKTFVTIKQLVKVSPEYAQLTQQTASDQYFTLQRQQPQSHQTTKMVTLKQSASQLHQQQNPHSNCNKRVLASCFSAFKNYSVFNQEKNQIMQQLLESALETREHTLLKKAFRLLKQNSSDRPKLNERSRLYTLFSSWKFYTKERRLLKKYLLECGESPTNMSLMSTGEMRQNAERQSQISLPSRGLSSSGPSLERRQSAQVVNKHRQLVIHVLDQEENLN